MEIFSFQYSNNVQRTKSYKNRCLSYLMDKEYAPVAL